MPNVYTKTNTHKRKRVGKIFGALSIALGAIVLIYFFFPVISYQFFLSGALATGTIESPVPKGAQSSGGVSSLLSQGMRSLTHDYTDARNWFPDAPAPNSTPKITRYKISIPKLRIENAEVATDVFDLSNSLVQYYGAEAPPGKGSAVIYGHSNLPQFYDPKNYKAIFATVHTLELGDEILTEVNGKTYRYKIFSMNITDPDDPNIFSQSYDNSYITLVTCTPPGTTWKRLVVRASLEKEI